MGYLTAESNIQTSSFENHFRMDELLRRLKEQKQTEVDNNNIQPFTIETDTEESMSQEGTRIKLKIRNLISSSKNFPPETVSSSQE